MVGLKDTGEEESTRVADRWDIRGRREKAWDSKGVHHGQARAGQCQGREPGSGVTFGAR